jgi:hypothetical protein
MPARWIRLSVFFRIWSFAYVFSPNTQVLVFETIETASAAQIWVVHIPGSTNNGQHTITAVVSQ